MPDGNLMAGKKGCSGRKPKPIALHVAAGTFRADRHGDPATHVHAEGKPEKPYFEHAAASDLWDSVVDELIGKGLAAAIDAAQLRIMCNQFALYIACESILMHDPTDEAAGRQSSRFRVGFDSIAARFGLTAVDRMKLRVEAAAKPTGIQARKRG